MKRLLALLLALAGGCNAELPEIPAERFACDDDTALQDGSFPCPESHWCREGQCVPRLGCFEPDRSLPGCTPLERRCDLLTDPEISAVACLPGSHFVETSTRPPGIEACDCPDGTWCVTYAGGVDQGDAYPLYLLSPTRGSTLPRSQLQLEAELPGARVCTHVCSSELDCPGGHTCRAAAVVNDGFLEDPTTSRHTVGVCFPELVLTSSLAQDQPDPEACLSIDHCKAELGRTEGVCQSEASVIPDHPRNPIGPAWGTRLALRSHCTKIGTARGPGLGCSRHEECSSGVCSDGRCALLCDPTQSGFCVDNPGQNQGGAEACRAVEVERALPGEGETVRDRVYICR